MWGRSGPAAQETPSKDTRFPFTVGDYALIILALMKLFNSEEMERLHVPEMPINEATALVMRMLEIEGFTPEVFEA